MSPDERAEPAPPAAPSPVVARTRADGVALAWLPVLLYTGTIWWLSSGPVPLENIEKFPMQDKGIHFLEYGFLCLMVCFAVHRTWPGRGVRAAFAAVLITLGLGLLDEFHQAFVPSRSADLADLVADALGALFFAASYQAISAWRRRALSRP